jgi:hypothetical protein
MFIAMNRFKVLPGQEAAFEEVWLNRETHLEDVPGFKSFHLLRGPKNEDHTLDLGLARGVRGLDEVGSLPQGPRRGRLRQADLHGPPQLRRLRGAAGGERRSLTRRAARTACSRFHPLLTILYDF